jgi:protein TonB
MRQDHRLGSDSPELPGLRTFIVPADIVAVPRRSPVRPRKRTPLKPIAEGQHAVDRTGGRDWFGAHLSAHATRPPSSRVFGASLLVNVVAVAAISALMLNRSRPANPEPRQPLFVSVALALGSPIVPEIAAPEPAAPQPATADTPRPKAEEPAVAIEAPAPVEAPAGIQADAGAPPPSGPLGSAIGSPDGGAEAGNGDGGASSGAAKLAEVPQGPMRLVDGIEPPKKVKDVKAVYPPVALARLLRGTVVIEATISAAGRVVDAVVLRSIPELDQAALDAVRQWEYDPARLKGVPVAVIMTVTVTFAIL